MDSSAKYTRAIIVNNNSEVTLKNKKGDINISINAVEKNEQQPVNVDGIKAENSSIIKLDSENNIIIKSKSKVDELLGQSNGGNTVNTIWSLNGSNINLNASGYIYLHSEDENGVVEALRASSEGTSLDKNSTININTYGISQNGFGLIVNVEGKQSRALDAYDGSVYTNTYNGGSIYLSAKSNEDTSSIHCFSLTDDANVILNAQTGNIYLLAKEDGLYSDNTHVYGIKSTSYGKISNVELKAK